jgi:hypothetical protein
MKDIMPEMAGTRTTSLKMATHVRFQVIIRLGRESNINVE